VFPSVTYKNITNCANVLNLGTVSPKTAHIKHGQANVCGWGSACQEMCSR